MHTLEIPDKSLVIDFPSGIDEMSDRTFVFYVGLVLQYVNGKIGEVLLKKKLLQHLLDLKMSMGYIFLNNSERQDCDTNLVRLSDLMDSFFEEYTTDGEKIKAFRLKSTRNFVPRILGYHGPANCFENLTFCEYRIARNYFRQFAETNEETFLNFLIAVLYRPAKPFYFIRRFFPSFDGQVRIPFSSKSNQLTLERRAGKISKVPFPIRYCVFLYFCSCEDFFKTGKPVIDGVEIDFSQLYTDSQSEDKASVGLVGLLYSLAETGVFGSIENTDSQFLWDIMVRIYQVVMQSKESIEKLNKN